MSKTFNSYDPSAAFPQPAQMGLGTIDVNGNHMPPVGLTGHDVTAQIALEYGPDNDFYTTTAAAVLTPKTQGEVDAIIAARQAETDKIGARRPTAESRLKSFASLPAIQSIKTLTDAETFIDSQVSDLPTAQDAMAKLLFAIINIVRAIDHLDDDYFPGDE